MNRSENPTEIIESARKENAHLVELMEADCRELIREDFIEKWGDDPLTHAIIANR